MLFHILKKDLKRKRTMNMILLLFIVLATIFLASSVSNLITITGAVDYFLETAKTADYLIVAGSEESETPIEEFLKECEYVTEYEVIDAYTLMDENIEIVECAQDVGKTDYEKGNTLSLFPVPENFAKVFDESGEELCLNTGELAMPKIQAEKNNLQVGDVIRINCEGREKEFTIRSIVKDAIFGTSYMGYKRLFISKEDYKELVGETPSYHTLLYNVNCSDEKEFVKEYRQNNFEVLSMLDKATVKMCYIFDMLLTGILIVVSICLILISFLILRFTIVFTLQEDYKEIGIMKAIGITDMGIKGIYLVKYLAIALAGAAIGLIFSFPFGKFLISKSMQNIMASDVNGNIGVNLLCALGIIIIILLFCFLSTGKVGRFTAIEAIRKGGNGERYQAKNVLKLYKRKRMPPAVYMACNDVISNAKRYFVLAAVFCIGTLLILLPLKAVHTLQDEEIIRLFGLQSCSVLIETSDLEKYLAQKDKAGMNAYVERIEEELKQEGMDAEVWVELGYMISCYGNDPNQRVSYFTQQQVGKDEDNYDVIEGEVPVFPNEIMLTEKTAEELGVGIGDAVYFEFPEEVKEFIVTGTFQSMMNMGNGLRVGKAAQLPDSYLSGCFNLQADIETDLKDSELVERMSEHFPDYKIKSGKEYIEEMVGISEQMDDLIYLITVTVLLINMLITLLTMKSLITRERGEIAMLKSIGFAEKTIKGWQCTRILLVLASSILLGTVLSHFLAPVTIGPIFAMMGATSIKLVTNSLEAYVAYPLILLIVTGATSYLCASEIKKVDLKEINTLE